MSAFYRLYRDPDARRKGLRLFRLDAQPDLDLQWWVGQRFSHAPTTPIRCTLAPGAAEHMPDAFLFDQIPLFSSRLVECLRGVGVDNLDCYEAVLETTDGRPHPAKFFAVNIVGVVACVDEVRSIKDALSAYPMTEFRELVVDPAAVGGAHLFRLADNPGFILVDEAVKRGLETLQPINVRALQLTERAAY